MSPPLQYRLLLLGRRQEERILIWSVLLDVFEEVSLQLNLDLLFQNVLLIHESQGRLGESEIVLGPSELVEEATRISSF